MQHAIPTVRIDGAARLLAHKRLDREDLVYEVERVRAIQGKPPFPERPIETVRKEARALVELRYDNESAHELYMSSRKAIRITPACQSDCDNCHRVLALVNMRGLCETRSEYRTLMNWIMDPGFLA